MSILKHFSNIRLNDFLCKAYLEKFKKIDCNVDGIVITEPQDKSEEYCCILKYIYDNEVLFIGYSSFCIEGFFETFDLAKKFCICDLTHLSINSVTGQMFLMDQFYNYNLFYGNTNVCEDDYDKIYLNLLNKRFSAFEMFKELTSSNI